MFQVAKNAKYAVNIKIKADNTTIPLTGCECWIVEIGGEASDNFMLIGDKNIYLLLSSWPG